MITIKFYNVKIREAVEVPEDQVEYVTMKNGRKAAKTVVTNSNGTKINLFRSELIEQSNFLFSMKE